ncbi:MAG: hypothetical protein KJ935_06150 [Candidatus Omnitrophica bacterium]|nr:hypothetical protein [Candidatus Omnitrophota bacterium]
MDERTQSQSSVYVRTEAGHVVLGNSYLELGFSQTRNGALTSILDKATGYQLRRDAGAPAPLWRLAVRHLPEQNLEWHDSGEAARLEWTQNETGGTITLTLASSGLSIPGLKVSVKISLAPNSLRSVWHMAVTGIPADAALYQLTCPIISGLPEVGNPAPGEALAVPVQGEGYLFKNPFPVKDRLPLCSGPGPETADVGLGRVSGLYPGNLPMQMYAFYNNRAGLYLATHDAGQNVKEFSMAPWDHLGPYPIMSVSHFPGEKPGADVEINYDTIVEIFHGDWYDAADIYKAWATRQWWCEKKLWDRDIANWMRTGFGVFQMSNYDMPVLKINHPMNQIAGVVNKLSEETGVPLLGLVFNWEGGGAWTGPAGFFPPREGEDVFKEAMARLRKTGNYGFVYITGGCWYLKLPYEPVFDSWCQFNAEARPYAIKKPDGNPIIQSWCKGWENSWLCPHMAYTQNLTAKIFVRCLDLGCTVVQIDNFPCAGSGACYDPGHGHPIGHGSWWSEAWGRILTEVRRQGKARDANCAITTEGISENFIPWLDMYDHRAGNMEYFGHYSRGMPMGGETIPLFNYVYNEYIGSYFAAYVESNRPEVLYWTRGLGKALTQGVVPTGGRYFKEPANHNPVTIGFYRKVVRAAARECWPYIMFGEMLRPPRIDVPVVTAQYCKFFYDGPVPCVDPQQRHEVQDYAVQHATFRGRDGRIGYIFVNISEESVTFEVELSGYKTPSKIFDVQRITDGAPESWLKSTSLPRREKLSMQPLSVVLVEIKPCADF